MLQNLRGAQIDIRWKTQSPTKHGTAASTASRRIKPQLAHTHTNLSQTSLVIAARVTLARQHVLCSHFWQLLGQHADFTVHIRSPKIPRVSRRTVWSSTCWALVIPANPWQKALKNAQLVHTSFNTCSSLSVCICLSLKKCELVCTYHLPENGHIGLKLTLVEVPLSQSCPPPPLSSPV